MDIRRKTIQELEKKRDETVHVLLSIYNKIGRGLLTKKSDAVSQEKIHSFESMNEFRVRKNDEITVIQQTNARKQELTEQAFAVKKQINEFESQKGSRLEKLGEALFAHYSTAFSASFGSFYAEAEREEKNLVAHEEKAHEIQKEMETQGFFAKLVTQVKLLSVNTAIAQAKKRFLTIVSNGAQAVLTAKTLDDSASSAVLDTTLLGAYKEALSLEQEIAGQKEFASSINDLITEVQGRLNAMDAGGNPAKKVEQIRDDIHEKDGEQEKLCVDTGFSTVNNYIASDGTIIARYAQFDTYLFDEVMQKRLLLNSYNRRVEILEITGDIEAADKKHLSLEKSIADTEHKIVQMQESLLQLRGDVATLIAEREALLAKRNTLEVIEGDSVKLLSDE